MSSAKDETVYLGLDDIGPSGLSTEVSRKGGITECFQKVQVQIQESHKQEDMGEPACNKNHRLSELEQQLEIAETRCGTLKQQLDYMKMLYEGIGPPKVEPDKVKKDEEEEKEEPNKPVQIKAAVQVKASPQRPRTAASLEHKGYNSLEEVDTAGQKKSSSKLVVDLTRLDADGRQKNLTDKKITVQPDGGSHPEATSAEQVIQDILCGISDSVNRISFLNGHISEGINEHSQNFYNSTPAASDVYECPLQNIRSDGAIEQTYIPDEKGKKRKKPLTRGGRQEIGHDCPIESGRSVVLSSRRKHRKHHRPRTVGVHTPSNIPNQHQPPNYVPHFHAKEKQLKVQGTYIDSAKRGSVDVTSSSPTKTKKKRGKAKLPRTCNARSHSSISVELDNIVELYHNKCARPATSASEDNGKPFEASSTNLFLKDELLEGVRNRISDETMTVERLIQHPEVYEETLPPPVPPPPSLPPPPPPSSLQRISDGVQMVTLPEGQEPKLSLAQDRNFQLPTVSSRMKQADRRFLPRFNCRSIPFVVGRSTTPSHNLGLNIQQILSFIKMRHSQTGLPTLSVSGNILRERTTFSVGMGPSRPGTTTSSHIGGFRRGYCPLAAENKTDKPDGVGDTFEQEEEQNYPDGTSNEKLSPADYAAPYMPDEIKSNKSQWPESVWEVEQEPPPKDKNSNRRCTCFPTRECIDYQKLLSQYLESGEGMSFFQLVQSPSSPFHHAVHQSHLPQTAGKDLEKAVSVQGLSEIKCSRIDENNNHPLVTSCSSRSQGLREVLVNLHNDFVRLTRKYQKVQATMTDGGVEEAEALRQLEAIEAELQTKESEITVVMALYKEVLSLKEQVRTLKQRTRSQSMETLGMRSRRQRQIIPREPTVSVRLTKLLRTVQQYQDRLRSEL